MPQRGITEVRFGLYCLGCLPGFHLPFLAGASPEGVFAEHGLDVEILEPPPGGGVDSVRRTAEGGTDFCLTSVGYYLQARAQVADLAARFIAVVGRRSPMAGLVAAGSALEAPADLGGRRVGAMPGDGLAAEYEGALAEHGIAAPVRVPVPYADAPAALARGEIDVVADFADLLPRARRWSGIEMRAIPVGVAHYANGVVAGDHVPDEHVEAMGAAVSAALEHQRAAPSTGLENLIARCPDIEPADALEGWSIGERTIFGADAPGSMDHAAWEATIAYTAGVHGVPAVPAGSVYRSRQHSRT
ncbi:MAG: ABC transporter substrate-binding protein [Acidimicrobiia bacterium]|nr:ABC transporter substrate-binding protein [Acidimicrobiia bacterium]